MSGIGIAKKGLGIVLKQLKKPGKALERTGDKWYKKTRKLQTSKKKSEKIRGSLRVVAPMAVAGTAGVVLGVKDAKEEIRELIQQLINEYMSTGVHEQLGDMASTGLTSDDGNNVTSRRPFYKDGEEIEYYNNQGAPYGGAEGQQTRGMGKSNMGNPNSQKQVRF